MKIDIGRPGKRSWCRVKIHEWDAHYPLFSIGTVVAALLKKYKKINNGTPFVIYQDTFGSNKFDFSDEDHKKAEETWNGILDKIIWSMEEFAKHNANEPKIPKSFFMKEWVDEDGMRRCEFQWENEIAEKNYDELLGAYHSRIKEGCELFGKYFLSIF